MMLLQRMITIVLMLVLAACDDASTTHAESPSQTSQEQAGSVLVNEVADENSSLSETDRIEESLAEIEARMGMKLFAEPRTGDLDVMIEERVIRVLTVYGLGRYYLEEGKEHGLAYDWFQMFENFVNEKLNTKHMRVHVIFVPVARDQLIPALLSGRGDIAAAGLTITEERSALVDFSDPATREISEVMVMGPNAPVIDTINDLAGRQIHVRTSSSYHSSLKTLNQRFAQQGLAEIDIQAAPEELEDEDLLEMVNAGLLNWVVVDNYKASIWAEVFDKLTVRDDLTFRTGGRIGYAMRKNSPQLADMLNAFIKTHKQGTLKGNILINRYLKNFDWAKNALAPEDYQRYQEIVDIFQKFGNQYGVDYLMVMAQGYQESRLDQNAKSGAGALGIMQLLPSTAADANVGIPDISSAESNIHAGIKYLNFIRERYFSDPKVNQFNQTMFAFAAYNAGPARVRQLRRKATEKGYDANVWFDNVEVIAAQEIGRETVQYVANILKYYLAYSLTTQQQLEREKARESVGIE